MTLQQQVPSLELCKRLKELGYQQESHFRWWVNTDGETSIMTPKATPESDYPELGKTLFVYSSPTVAELGEMLPWRVEKYGKKYYFSVEKARPESDYKKFEVAYWFENNKIQAHEILTICSDDTEANARAKMLIYLLENKLITL